MTWSLDGIENLAFTRTLITVSTLFRSLLVQEGGTDPAFFKRGIGQHHIHVVFISYQHGGVFQAYIVHLEIFLFPGDGVFTVGGQEGRAIRPCIDDELLVHRDDPEGPGFVAHLYLSFGDGDRGIFLVRVGFDIKCRAEHRNIYLTCMYDKRRAPQWPDIEMPLSR